MGLKMLCLLSLNSLIMGFFMLMCSLCVSFLLSLYLMSWYSLMFFLIYMGGLLVLFMYISSLKFNPVFFVSKMNPGMVFLMKTNTFLLLVVALSYLGSGSKSSKWEKMASNKYSLNLFKQSEMTFLMGMGAMLLVVLWVMTKLSFRNRSALRPFFG